MRGLLSAQKTHRLWMFLYIYLLKIYYQTKTFQLHENIPLYYFFIDFIKEHLIAHIGVNDSYLEKLLRDHAVSVIQNVWNTNTLKSYRTYFSKLGRCTDRFEEVKLLPAEGKYVGVYLLDLVKQGDTFNAINMSWLVREAYQMSCDKNICNSFFCLFDHLWRC